MGGVAGTVGKTRHQDKVGENPAGNPGRGLEKGMKRHDPPRVRRNKDPGKGGNFCRGNERERDL